MDTIWDRKSFEVGGHWPLWRMKKRMTMQKRQKSNAKKQTLSIKTYLLGGQRKSFLFKISLSTSVSVPPLFILTDTSFDTFHLLMHEMIFSL